MVTSKTELCAAALPHDNLSAYGMGSALTNTIGKSGLTAHSKHITTMQLKAELDLWRSKYHALQTELRALPKDAAHKKARVKNIKKLEDVWTILYGAPVFLAILDTCNTTEITVSGLGMMFWYY